MRVVVVVVVRMAACESKRWWLVHTTTRRECHIERQWVPMALIAVIVLISLG